MGFIKNSSQTDSQISTDIRNIFVGRANDIEFFIQEILNPGEPTYNIISIWGSPGVGKSTLLTRFIDISHESNFKDYCLTAQVDEMQATPSSVMEKIADQLRIAGYPLVDFEQSLRNYNETLRNFRTSQGFEREIFLERTILNSTNSALKHNLGLDGYLREEINSVIQNFGEEYRNIQIYKDMKRIEDPIAELTNAFISDLNRLANTAVVLGSQIANHPRRILLFFDSFEQLASDIVPWLLNYFLEASINSNIVLIVAGHVFIERSIHSYQRRWQKYKNAIKSIFLDSFTEEEAYEYLNAQGITDSKSISLLLHLSERLPYSLSLLTSSTHSEFDITKDVVNNFLRMIPESEGIKIKLALEAALLSRPFNQDDLKAFSYVSEENRPALYRWLCEQPFVRSNPLDGRHSYHDLARNNFSRHLYQNSPDQYKSVREALASYYQQLLNNKLQIERGNGVYKTVEGLELVFALAYQLFLLPEEECHINAIEKILEAYRYTNIKQDGELVRFLRVLLEDKPTNMAGTDVQQIANNLIQYIETSPAKRVQEFIAATSFFIEKLSRSVSSKQLLLASIYCLRGDSYVSLQKIQLALVDFNQAIKCSPSYAGAYRRLGQVYYRLKDYNKALTNLDHAIRCDSKEERTFLLRGQIYQSMEYYEDALRDFESAIELNTKLNLVLYLLKGQLLFNRRRYQEASDSLVKALAESPDIIPAWLLLAQISLRLHPYQEIPGFLKTISIPEADSVLVTINRAMAMGSIGLYEKAIPELTQVVELEPENTEAHIQLGIIYDYLGYYEDAINEFTRANEIDGENTKAMFYRGKLYVDLNIYTKGLHDLNSVLGKDADNISALLYRSQIYRHLRQYNEALRDLDSVMKSDLDFEHQVLEEKSKIWEIRGNTKEALGALLEGLKIEPTCDECWRRLGKAYGVLYPYREIPKLLRDTPVPNKEAIIITCYRGMSMFLMNCYEDAITELSKAIEAEPDNNLARFWRSQVYSYFNLYQKALDELDSIMEKNTYVSHAIQERRGKTLQYLGKNEQAFDAFIDGLKTNNMCENCWIDLAITYELLNGRNGTTQWLKKLSISGVNTEMTLLYRAKALAMTYHYKEAIQILNEAIEFRPNDFRSMHLLSDIYSNLNRYEDALAVLLKLLKLMPNDVDAILKRGKIYCLIGRPKDALKDFDLAIKLDFDYEHEGQEGRGVAFYSLQRYKEAISTFSQALASNPTCDECWSRLIDAYEASYAKSQLPELLRKVPISDTNKPLAIATRAEALGARGYYHEALVDFDYAFALDDVAVVNHLSARGLVFSYLKQYGRAIKCYASIPRYQISYQNLYNIAVAMVRWKGFPEAQEYVDAAHKALLTQIHTINHTDAIYGLGGLAALTGNTAQALDYLRQAILFNNFNSTKYTEWAQHDMAWVDLRSDERLKALISIERQVSVDELDFYKDEIPEKQHDVENAPFAIIPSSGLIISNRSPLKVFLCCSPNDKAIVQELYHRLVTDGIDVWFDEKNLLPGQDREIEVRREIRSSDIVVVCLSNNIQKAGFIHKQISYALEASGDIPEEEVFIIPAKLEECDIPEQLRRWHCVSLFDEEGYERLVASLRSKTSKLDLSN